MPKKSGRKSVVTSEVLEKLEQAFSVDCTVQEACIFSGISRSALFRYSRANPDFETKKERWKTKLVLLARIEVIKGLRGNPDLAFKFLERKLPEEFGRRRTVANPDMRTKESEEYREGLRRLIIEFGNYPEEKAKFFAVEKNDNSQKEVV